MTRLSPAEEAELKFGRERSEKSYIDSLQREISGNKLRINYLADAGNGIRFPCTDQTEANIITGSRVIRCAIVRKSRSSSVRGRVVGFNAFHFDIQPCCSINRDGADSGLNYRTSMELSNFIARKKLKSTDTAHERRHLGSYK